jgi:hypothetical protein
VIKIKTAQYGIIPYGGGQAGDRAFAIEFEDIDNTNNYPILTHDELKFFVNMKLEESVKKSSNIAKFVDIINADLEEAKQRFPEAFKHFTDALLSKIQFYIIGNCLEKEIYADYSVMFFGVISHNSLEMQKAYHVSKWRPPFFVFLGYPKEHTKNRLYYEQFGYLLIHCPVRNSKNEILTEENNDIYKPFAFIEMTNHAAAVLVFKIKEKEELDVLFNVYLKNLDEQFITKRVVLLADDNYEDENSVIKDVLQFAYNHNMRYNINYRELIEHQSIQNKLKFLEINL